MAIDSYVVNTYRYNPATGAYDYVASVESCGACTSAEIVGLTTDVIYSFAVFAHNNNGYSPPSTTNGQVQPGTDQTYAGHPQAVGGNGSVTMSWSAPYAATALGLTGYWTGIFYAGTNTPAQQPYTFTTGLTQTFTGLTNGQNYYAEVTPSYTVPGYNSTVATNNALAGPLPPDTLAGGGQRSFFSYTTFKVSDQTTAKVNLGSGDLTVSQNDVSLPGVGGSYSVGQNYNSLALDPQASSAGSHELSPGWRFNTGADVRLAIGNGTVTYYDRSGAAWDFTYAGGVWNQPAGLDVTLAYDPVAAAWSVADHGTNEKLNFDAAGVLVSDVDRNGIPVTFSYEAQLSPAVRVTGSAGMTTANSVVIAPGSDGRVHSFVQYPGDGSPARTTSLVYNSAGQLISVTDAAGEVTNYGYDSAGNLGGIASPGGHFSFFFYDSSHRVIQAEQYDGSRYDISYYSYAAPGNTVVTDPDGHPPVVYAIDAAHRVTKTTDPAGGTTAATWTGDSQVGSSTNQAGGTTTNTYNANMGVNGNESLTQTQGPTGTTNSGAYTGACNPPSSKYLPATTTAPVVGTAKNCYDNLGNPTSATDPAGNMSSVTYNADGTPATSTSPNGQTNGVKTNYTEDYGHQVYLSAPSNGIGPDHFTVYDVWGNVAATANFASGNASYLTHDAMGRTTQTSATPGPANIVNTTYDPDGNVTRQVDNSGTTTTGYDQLGRSITRTAPNGVNDTYAYDPASNLTSVTDTAGTTGYHYNTLNQVDQVTEPSGRLDVLGYDPMGHQADLWTNTGTAVAYNGSVIIPPANFATHRQAGYDNAGQISSLATTLASNNNNVFSKMSYYYITGSNCTGEPANVTTGQIRFESDRVRNLQNGFCYDYSSRLIAAVVNNVFSGYGYDANGNPTAGALGAHTYNTADQTTDTGYTYNADGNLTASPALTATYNSADQTTAITPAGTATTSFAYTGTGQATRSSATTAIGSVTYANGLLGIEGQTDLLGGTTASYIYLPNGTLLDESTPTGGYYYITDHQNSVIGLASPTGVSRASYTYTPYGAQTATALNGTLPTNPYGYNSGYTDTTGLIHFAARYYNPTTGRWTQLDPSGQNPGYQYAGDDPINSSDPSGQMSPDTCNGESVIYCYQIVGPDNSNFVLGFTISILNLGFYAGTINGLQIEITGPNGINISTQATQPIDIGTASLFTIPENVPLPTGEYCVALYTAFSYIGGACEGVHG